MKEKTKKDGKLAATLFFIGLIFLIIGLAAGDSIPERTAGYFFFNLLTVLGIGIGLIGGIQGLIVFSYNSAKEKITEIKEQIAEKEEEKKFKEQAFESMSRYNDAQQSFLYLSNETLLKIYDDFKQKGLENMERLALEEELVKRGLIEYSPMHEMLYLLKKDFLKE